MFMVSFSFFVDTPDYFNDNYVLFTFCWQYISLFPWTRNVNPSSGDTTGYSGEAHKTWAVYDIIDAC